MNEIEIETRIEYIKEKLKTLKLAIGDYDMQEKTFEKYKSLKTIERDSEEIIESAVRINQEILADTKKIAETYRDSFLRLLDLKIFENDDFFEKICNTVGFRNRLAHNYINLDEEITVKSAKEILKIYPKYLLKIQDYVDSKNN